MAGFQVVTMGERASEETEKLQAAGDYSEAYFLHGLSVQMAEAMADYVNARINRELGLGEGEAGARRYSWGYAAIPELADHERVFRLLGVPEAIGVTLTESYQLVPGAVHRRHRRPAPAGHLLRRPRITILPS